MAHYFPDNIAHEHTYGLTDIFPNKFPYGVSYIGTHVDPDRCARSKTIWLGRHNADDLVTDPSTDPGRRRSYLGIHTAYRVR
ncbi:Hypothetical Protein FCC1311_032272 [Hondaea fermentalgiana]|uniref:Uncharacterized protein n=1 Tax=Hondaea fermentalgiana TaxID=2315210 RepID=A0A2R5GGM1_9STRA|nr:Hypothetical Protein FCC1311_032272 [Hondaea fermentalgiana]|eukprot:GBG27004.1 Hypothetical Protein FCC1311_032272 [Hondaea fermentalgiana]